jgi:hypothetical protein
MSLDLDRVFCIDCLDEVVRKQEPDKQLDQDIRYGREVISAAKN